MSVSGVVFGPIANRSNSIDFGQLFLGLLIPDGENGQEIQFKKMSETDLLKMNLTQAEAQAHNDNTEELIQAFKMVSNDLTKESKVEDAKKPGETLG